ASVPSRTWRRRLAASTVTVAVAAFVGAWLIRRAQSPPVPFSARDWILITRFENRAGEPLFDGTLDWALQWELSSSPYVNAVSQVRKKSGLQAIGRPTDTIVNVDVGRELAKRDGQIRLLLAGRVSAASPGYLLEADIVAPSDGSVIRTVSANATKQSDFL